MTSTPAEGDRVADARAAFVTWGSRQPGAPRDVSSLVLDVAQSETFVGLLSSAIEGRRVVWRSLPYSGKGRATFPSITESVDAWSIDAATLRTGSDHIAVCPACGGQGKVGCTTCGQTGRVRCTGCNGQRKRWGYASNGSRRLLNCTFCHGKGEVECGRCHRGLVSCESCAGDGRVQRWLELEQWQRVVANLHPSATARLLGWPDDPLNDLMARDATLVADIDKSRALTRSDLTAVPAEWLTQLAPSLQAGERVTRQRMRMARIEVHGVRYRIVDDEGLAEFYGPRFVAGARHEQSAFVRRASKLRSVAWALVAAFAVITLFLLARGPFYRSAPTLLSVAGWAAALGALYGAAVEWTGARVRTRRWLYGVAGCALLALIFALVAMPRSHHAEKLIAAGNVDAAEEELLALGTKAGERQWAELRLARIRATHDVTAARELLEQIPRNLPQRALAEEAVDRLVLRNLAAYVQQQRWSDGAALLANLSDAATRRAEAIAMATTIYVALAREKSARHDWSGMADVIAAAARFGIATSSLAPFAQRIYADAVRKAAEANANDDVAERLRQRLVAEGLFVAWERASGNRDTPALLALRTSMAHDVAILEKRRSENDD